jgi:hypothetical protein
MTIGEDQPTMLCYKTPKSVPVRVRALLPRMLIEGKMYSTFHNIRYGSLSA